MLGEPMKSTLSESHNSVLKTECTFVELGYGLSSAGLSRLHGRDPAEIANFCLNKEAAISAQTVAAGPLSAQPYRNEFGIHPL
jgi:hypothetical protein